ncbi:hypothetical protein GIB67_014880 [Kingdonia uniflora]|uniref:Uncharacterized protein n=1 Tax=Kingdonia uniflora TaxID=39325 RepID=A0A7J7MT69_9MAGN|nr:hypothetical protein GIB67_014880 [Kingdonia uniflora]
MMISHHCKIFSMSDSPRITLALLIILHHHNNMNLFNKKMSNNIPKSDHPRLINKNLFNRNLFKYNILFNKKRKRQVTNAEANAMQVLFGGNAPDVPTIKRTKLLRAYPHALQRMIIEVMRDLPETSDLQRGRSREFGRNMEYILVISWI